MVANLFHRFWYDDAGQTCTTGKSIIANALYCVGDHQFLQARTASETSQSLYCGRKMNGGEVRAIQERCFDARTIEIVIGEVVIQPVGVDSYFLQIRAASKHTATSPVSVTITKGTWQNYASKPIASFKGSSADCGNRFRDDDFLQAETTCKSFQPYRLHRVRNHNANQIPFVEKRFFFNFFGSLGNNSHTVFNFVFSHRSA